MTGAGPVGIGVIGAGVISDTYLSNLAAFPDTTVVAIGDVRPDAARAKADAHGVGVAGDVDTVLAHPDVEIVVNLTIPAAHSEISERALQAGRHVWTEKPLALDGAAGRALLAAAAAAGLRIGSAPDTFLGAALQAARRLIDDGAIGEPLTALALFQSPGPDAWHPNPDFLFQAGAGPLFDLGPYYLTALVQVLGPITSVAAVASTARLRRTIGSGPRAGETFAVTAPSHSAAIVRFARGGSAQTIFSFDSALRRALLEVTGRDATMILPDPNEFDGEIGIRRPGGEDPEPPIATTAASTRGTGVLEMARAIRAGRPHRAGADLALHVVDVMAAIAESAETGSFVAIESTTVIPRLLPEDWDAHAATL